MSLGRDFEIPVFVQPSEVCIDLSNNESFRQLITLINPFDFVLYYKVLSNAPSKFKVYEPSGYIRPKCVVEIGFKHIRPKINDKDSLRIELFKKPDGKPCGRKDLKICIFTDRHSAPTSEYEFMPIRNTSSSHKSSRRGIALQQSSNNNRSWATVGICIISMIIVLMPTFEVSAAITSQNALSYFRPTLNFQLAAAFTLGLATMYLLRNNN